MCTAIKRAAKQLLTNRKQVTFKLNATTQNHKNRGDIPNEDLLAMMLKLSEQVERLNSKSPDSQSKTTEEVVTEAELMKKTGTSC